MVRQEELNYALQIAVANLYNTVGNSKENLFPFKDEEISNDLQSTIAWLELKFRTLVLLWKITLARAKIFQMDPDRPQKSFVHSDFRKYDTYSDNNLMYVFIAYVSNIV